MGGLGRRYLSISAACRHRPEAVEFLARYVTDGYYVNRLSAMGYVAPVVDASTLITSPLGKQLADLYEVNDGLTPLPADLVSPAAWNRHGEVVKALMAGRLSPEEAAREIEQAMRAPQVVREAPEASSRSINYE